MLYLGSNDSPLICKNLLSCKKWKKLFDRLYCLAFYWHASTLSEKFCSSCSWYPLRCLCVNQWNHAKRSEVAIRLTWWNPWVCLSPRFLSDLNHWRGLPANDEAISTTGLRVRARQALYYQQRSLFRTLLALHHSVVVSIGALVRPNLAFSHIMTWPRQQETINEASGRLKLSSKRC